MDIKIILIGVTIISGLAVRIFRRRGGWGEDDYGYHVPRTGTWGVGQRSVEEAIGDAEQGVEWRYDED